MTAPAIRRVFPLLAALAVLLAAAGAWHVSGGPPYHEGRLGLLILFAGSAALAGLLMAITVLSAWHWAKQVAAILISGSALLFVWLLFNEGYEFFIWQLLLVAAAQIITQVLAFGGLRLARYQVEFGPAIHDVATRPTANRFSLADTIYLTTALAIASAVLSMARAVELPPLVVCILIAGGMSAAIVAVAGVWLGFGGGASGAWRIGPAIAAAPLGGVVYAITDRFENLLFSAPWYAAVTSVELLLVAAGSFWLRRQGFRLTRHERPTP